MKTMVSPLSEIYSTMINKATLNSTLGAYFHPQDMSKVIYLNGSPTTPFLKRLQNGGKVNGSPHYWNKISLASVTGTSSYFVEGDAPTTSYSTPTPYSNTIFQLGKAAQITDKEAALYANPGGFQLADGERMRWFRESMALQMELRTRETIQEMDYIFINGVKETTIPASSGVADVQCDGLLEFIATNTDDCSAVAIDDSLLIDLAKAIHDQYSGRFPDVLYVTSAQKKVINTWATNIWFTRDRNLEAGKDVSTFNTGYGILPIEVEPYMPSGSCAMVDMGMFKKMDLIPLTAEGLARTDTSVKRMITYYGTLECGNDISSGKLTNLSA